MGKKMIFSLRLASNIELMRCLVCFFKKMLNRTKYLTLTYTFNSKDNSYFVEVLKHSEQPWPSG